MPGGQRAADLARGCGALHTVVAVGVICGEAAKLVPASPLVLRLLVHSLLFRDGTGRTNSFAIGAFVCGLVGFSGLWPSFIVAIILGHRALGKIRESQGSGHGHAKAGLVLGYVGVALGGLGVLSAILSSAPVRVGVHG